MLAETSLSVNANYTSSNTSSLDTFSFAPHCKSKVLLTTDGIPAVERTNPHLLPVETVKQKDPA